jgi:hypothetical protein
MKETQLYLQFKKWIPKDCFFYKTHDSCTRGIPDFYIQYRGEAIWIEAKVNHKLTMLQQVTLKDLKKQGAKALVLKGNQIGDIDLFDMDKQAFSVPVFDITQHSFEVVFHGK